MTASAAPAPPTLDPVPRSVSITFGGTIGRFESDDAAWLSMVRTRFSGFESRQPASFVVAHTSDGERPFAKVDVAGRSIEVVGPPDRKPIDSALRSALPDLVGDGIVFHAAALIDRRRRGWLFTGPAESGKSTIAHLFPELAACDELALASRSDGSWRVLGLPFWTGRPDEARLRAIFLLRHGHDEARRVPAARAPARLAETLCGTSGGERGRRRLELLVDLAEQVPVWELFFRPARDLWRVVESVSDE